MTGHSYWDLVTALRNDLKSRKKDTVENGHSRHQMKAVLQATDSDHSSKDWTHLNMSFWTGGCWRTGPQLPLVLRVMTVGTDSPTLLGCSYRKVTPAPVALEMVQRETKTQHRLWGQWQHLTYSGQSAATVALTPAASATLPVNTQANNSPELGFLSWKWGQLMSYALQGCLRTQEVSQWTISSVPASQF